MSAPGAVAPEVIIEFQGATKRFPGVLALDHVDLSIRRGEVHVLVGQNGAGKSTLVKLLCGNYAPDEGAVLLEGRPYAPRSSLAAIRAGIRIVYQEINLLPYLTVAENIFFQHLPGRFGLVDFGRLDREAQALLREVGLDVSPRTRVETLGVAQMQLVEIAKALSTRSKVLILDEPTAALTPGEIGRLFAIIARLKARGVTVLYISHRLQEVFEVGDRVTVLRNGRKVETVDAREASIPRIVRLMVGREMGTEYPFHPEVVPGALGLILPMPCYANITLTDLHRVARFTLLQPGAERAAARQLVDDLSIRTPSVDQLVGNLSGGNQQKVVIAKWLFRQAEVLVFDEPTRGIDVGARLEIYDLLWRLAAAGKGILIVSSDLPELMGICHRILVFSNGRITGDLPRAEFSQERILDCAYQEYVGSRPGGGARTVPPPAGA